MKSLYKYLGMAALAVSVTACGDDFLDVKSPTQESAEEYFSTREHVAEAVVAAYDPLQWTDWGIGEYAPYILMSDIMADDLWVGGSDANDNQNWHLMANYQATPLKVITSIWVEAFSGVKRCNDVLGYIEAGIDDATQADIDSWTAQVKVLRAFYSNWLWKFYGNVPYYTVNLTSPYIAEQISADELYDQMVSDIEEAIALNVLSFRESDAEAGRVTTAMAYMLYAEVVMYQRDASRYGTALRYMKEIIDSPEYDLMDDYGEIFKESGEWCKESIWEINYVSENAVRDWNSPLTAGGTVLPTLISPNNWPSGQDGHNTGWGFCPVRLETYERYSADDARRAATCWDVRPFDGTYNKRYQDFGFFLEKYAAQADGNAGQKASGELNYNNNWRIYRYSETLLNAAELLVATGGSVSEAKGYLNQVRSRAGLRTQLEPTLDNIIEERHLEFVGEGKRYWDLIRTDKASTVLVPDEYGYRTNTWTPNKKHLPIPQSEIDRAQGTLTQNPY
ncbi:MAG: RagB/SusD family nutrient uptake outer membrane protein [Muribaculaceae bacterium]|nr:RagB/SusD family nutrient uptake outer membrane protein [Muribaculaceae bacterium]